MSEIIEFSRVFSLKAATDRPSQQHFEASPKECENLAVRFELMELKNFRVDMKISPREEPGSYHVHGNLEADVVQACVLTLQDVPSHVSSDIDVVLLPHSHPIFQGEEDMSDTHDYEPIENDTVDLGEIAAQYLSLALDPYPRHPSIANDDHPDGSGKSSQSPFSILARLKGEG